jgi:hypothetical protein
MQRLLLSIQRDPLLGAATALRGPKILILCIWTFAQEFKLQTSIMFIVSGSEDDHAVNRDAPAGADTDSGEDAMAARASTRARNDESWKIRLQMLHLYGGTAFFPAGRCTFMSRPAGKISRRYS